ncbi:MAG: hypothetical protein ABI183_18090 [Polyangiaceae bacterium]
MKLAPCGRSRVGVCVFLFMLVAVLSTVACESHDIPSGSACAGPYGPTTGHTCARGLQCTLIPLDAGGGSYLCAVKCRTSSDCTKLGAGYTCTPPMVHEGTGACVP